jgi:23S rRNA-/tRNA-specific pseudouridylate synthase
MVMNERAGLPVDAVHVIQEASGVVAVWKPAGLATQAPMGIASAESWLRQELHGESLRGYVGVPHRLDRGVSGVVLFAATPRAARKLSRQFERREVRKTYLAIVACGDADGETIERMSAEAVTWRDMVEKIADEARTRIVPADEPGGREAVTLARLRCRLPPDRLLLELSPVTGRMHQLRLQAAVRALPIVGDDLYGVADEAWMKPPQPNIPQTEATVVSSVDDPRMRPIALHACRITYADPDTRAEVTVEAALPTYWPESARSSQTLPGQPA